MRISFKYLAKHVRHSTGFITVIVPADFDVILGVTEDLVAVAMGRVTEDGVITVFVVVVITEVPLQL